MQTEKLFEIGFIVVFVTVAATVLCGCVFWILWFSKRARFNLCGDRSSDLITRLDQPVPRWSPFDFLVMFAVLFFTAAFLYALANSRAIDSNAATQQAATERQSSPEATEESVNLESSETDQERLDRSPDGDSEASEDRTPIALETQIQIQVVANLTALVAMLLFVRGVYGLTLRDLTLIPQSGDVRRGLVATIWILAPVLLINLVVANLVQYEHAVTDLLAEQADGATFVFLFFSAAVVTPIAEEFQFRLLLQGGLQRLADERNAPGEITLWNPSSAWPIMVTSIVFALMHLGQGAAPIPLFFLSVGLGYVYQRTGRLIPVIVVHMLLNGATVLMEFCKINANLTP